MLKFGEVSCVHLIGNQFVLALEGLSSLNDGQRVRQQEILTKLVNKMNKIMVIFLSDFRVL